MLGINYQVLELPLIIHLADLKLDLDVSLVPWILI